MQFIPMDSEGVEEMRRHQEEATNRSEVAVHGIVRLINELSETDLEAVGQMIAHISNNGPNAAATAAYWQGLVTGAMQHRFGRCAGCGNNHDADLASLSGQDLSEVSRPIKDVELPAEDQPALFKPGEIIYTPVGSKIPLNSGEIQVMVNHNLGMIRNGEGILEGFACMNCDQKYTSIQDRALRNPGPEGCPGCINKTKWG